MRVLLLSTYELGHQPLGIAGPAAALEEAGHDTRGVDLAISDWPAEAITWADAVAISIPMHTATRLAVEVLEVLHHERPGLPVALHGLYAPVLVGNELVGPSDLLVAGDPVPAMLAWLDGLAGVDGGATRADSGGTGSPEADRRGDVPGFVVDLGPPGPAGRTSPVPLRRDLEPLARYARLKVGAGEVVTASVEASR